MNDHDEERAILRDFATSEAELFARTDNYFDWRMDEPVSVLDAEPIEGGWVFRVVTPAAAADVEVIQQSDSLVASLGDAYTHRVGLASGPRPDDPYYFSAVDAQEDAQARSRKGPQTWAVWPVGRDVYHPDTLAFEGFLYRREP